MCPRARASGLFTSRAAGGGGVDDRPADAGGPAPMYFHVPSTRACILSPCVLFLYSGSVYFSCAAVNAFFFSLHVPVPCTTRSCASRGTPPLSPHPHSLRFRATELPVRSLGVAISLLPVCKVKAWLAAHGACGSGRAVDRAGCGSTTHPSIRRRGCPTDASFARARFFIAPSRVRQGRTCHYRIIVYFQQSDK